MITRCDSLGFADGPFKPIVFDGAFLDSLAESGSRFIMHITVCPPVVRDTETILQALETVTAQCDKQGVKILRRKSDLDLPEGSLGVLLGIQNPPYRINPEELGRLYRAGLRVMPIAYKGPTPYGGGYANKKRLTTTGRMLVFHAAKRFIIDISHTNNQTALDVLNMPRMLGGDWKMHVMSSHCGCASVFAHPRNHSNQVIEMLGRLNGYMGVYSLTFATSPDDDTLGPFVSHARRACELMGPDKVGIGSDGFYRHIHPVELRKTYDFMLSHLTDDEGKKDGIRFPDQPLEANTPERHQVMVEALERSDLFAHADIDGIAGGNFYRFLQRALPD